MVRLLDRPVPAHGAEIVNAWAYLVAATRNAAVDALRTRQRQRALTLRALSDVPRFPDDAVAALLDRDATHAAVLAAIKRGIEDRDPSTVRIITIWLDLADELQRAPSTREVAVRAGVSHTTVATALKRFKTLLSENM